MNNQLVSHCFPYKSPPDDLTPRLWCLDIFLDYLDEDSLEGLKSINIPCNKDIAEFLIELILNAQEKIMVPTEFFWTEPNGIPYAIAFTSIEPSEVKYFRYRLAISPDEIKKVIDMSKNSSLDIKNN